MREVVVLGVGMHPFGRFLEKSLTDLGRVAVWTALKDANVPAKDVQVAYVGNAIGGLITGQEGITKDEATKIKAALEEQGAKVEIK